MSNKPKQIDSKYWHGDLQVVDDARLCEIKREIKFLRIEFRCGIVTHIFIGLLCWALLLASINSRGADIELQPVAAWELYNRTGEIKGGAGLRGRYWFNEVGVEVQGLSLTPRDSIVDRSDFGLCYRVSIFSTANEEAKMDTVISAGYGSNWEDHAHGPGIGMAVQYNRGNWFGEVGTRSIWEDHSKSLLTFGIGRRF